MSMGSSEVSWGEAIFLAFQRRGLRQRVRAQGDEHFHHVLLPSLCCKVQRSEIVDQHRLCDEYRVFLVNYNIPNYYVDTFPVLYNKHINTDIKDYMFMLLERETRN
jgi:hypothetical protein